MKWQKKKVLIRRIFVSDGDYENNCTNELSTAIRKHKEYISELKCYEDGGRGFDYTGRLNYRVLAPSERDVLTEKTWLDPKLGFVLISRGEEKIVAFHRLVDGVLQGNIITDPLVYSIFEQHFWLVWNRTSPNQ